MTAPGSDSTTWLTVPELADRLKLSEFTIRKHLRSGTLPGVRLGNEWRVQLRSLKRALSASKRKEAVA